MCFCFQIGMEKLEWNFILKFEVEEQEKLN